MASNPFVLPCSVPASYTEKDVVTCLNSIFSNFPAAAAQYSLYFQLMPVAQSVNDLQSLFSAAVHSPDQIVTRQVHAVQNASGVSLFINAVVPSNLGGLDVFLADQPPGPDSGPQNSIMIILDGFNNSRVPIEIACAMEANFIDGFVTRLVLGQFKRFWDSDPNRADLQGYAPNPPFNLDLGSVTANQSTLGKFSQATTYPLYQRIPQLNRNTGTPTYETDLGIALAQSPISSIGMMYGWRAAEQMEQADGADPTQPLVQMAFKLLGFRFSIADLGEMTAFTLNYLNGATQNSAIQSIVKGTAPLTPPDLSGVLQQLGTSSGIDAAKDFLIGFENVLTAEFYALTQNTDPNLAPQKLGLLGSYFNFLLGFHEGIAKSADAHYEETLEMAFGLGYVSGFTDGYALGFANGYSDGFAAGNAVAWAAANQIIGSLQIQIKNLQTQLAQVQSAAAGGGSGDGFWNTVGKIGKAVQTAVGVISAFASATA